MPTVRGKVEVKRFIASLPGQIEAKLLRGAGRAAATVVVDEAKDQVIADVVRENLVMKTRAEPGRVVVTITVKPGWALSVANWLEYGTGPHLIRASDAARQGKSVGRINRLDKAAEKEGHAGPGHALVIGGKFVGEVVHHPGAKPHPFLRVSLDLKGTEAVAAAQSYINARVRPGGIAGGDQEDDEP